MNKSENIQFPICEDCKQRHYRKAGQPCQFIGTLTPRQLYNGMTASLHLTRLAKTNYVTVSAAKNMLFYQPRLRCDNKNKK